MANFRENKVALYRDVPGQINDWYGTGKKLGSPPGKIFGVSPCQNYSDAQHKAAVGSSKISVNAGIPLSGYSQRSGTGLTEIMIFQPNPTLFKNHRPTKSFNTWDAQDCDSFADGLIGIGLPWSWVWTGENYDNTGSWAPLMNEAPYQLQRILRRLQPYVDAMGGQYNNEYSGVFIGIVPYDTGQDEQMANAIMTPDGCLAWMKANETSWCQWYTTKGWEYQSPLLNTYHMLTDMSETAFVYRCMTKFALATRANQANEVTVKRKPFDFYMPSGSQTSFIEELSVSFPNGKAKTTEFPIVGWAAQVFQGCVTYNWADFRFPWSDIVRHGTDVGVQKPETVLNPQYGNPPRRGWSYEYDPLGAGVNVGPLGVNNAHETGAWWYWLIWQHTQTQNWSYARHRSTANNATYCDNGVDYIFRQYIARDLCAFVYSGSNGKKALLGYNFSQNRIVRQVDTGSSTNRTIEFAPAAPFLYLFPN